MKQRNAFVTNHVPNTGTGEDEALCPVAYERLKALPQSAGGVMRWNGDGSSSGRIGMVRIHTVVAPGPPSSPGG